MEQKKLKINKFNVLAYIPFIVFIAFTLILLVANNDLEYVKLGVSLGLLLITSICITKNKKWIRGIGYLSLTVFTLSYIIMGYFDYLRWTSTAIGITILVYYIVIIYWIMKIKKEENIQV